MVQTFFGHFVYRAPTKNNHSICSRGRRAPFQRLLKGLGGGVGCCLVFFSFFGVGYSVFTAVSFVQVGSRFGRSVVAVSFVIFISFACLVDVGRSGDFVLNLCWSFRLS